MTRKTLSRLSPDQSKEKATQAKQVLDLIDELEGELIGMRAYAALVHRFLIEEYPRHIEFKNFAKATRKEMNALLWSLFRIRGNYQQIVYDYEHEFGALDVSELPHLADLSTSIEELMAFAPHIDRVKGFFDE